MDLKSGYPFWAVSSGLMQAFPRLASDHRCDVAVLGGGITGALIADELASHGFDVAIQAVVTGVQRTVTEPVHVYITKRKAGVFDLCERFKPINTFAVLGPKCCRVVQ